MLFCQQAKAATEKEDSADPPLDGRIRFKKPTKRYSLQHQCFSNPNVTLRTVS